MGLTQCRVVGRVSCRGGVMTRIAPHATGHTWARDCTFNDVAYSLVATRASFDYRDVVVGAGRHELVSGLGAIAYAPAPSVAIGKAAASGGTVSRPQSGQRGSRVTGVQKIVVDSSS